MLGHRELTIDDYLDILRRRYWILILTALVGAAAAYLYSRALPNQFQSRALVLVQQPKVGQKFVPPVIEEQVNERLATMKEEILTPSQMEPLVKQYHLYEKQLPGSSLRKRTKLLLKGISVIPSGPVADSRGAGIPGFTVRVTLNDPHLAQEVCARVTTMFLEENTRWRTQATRDTTSFLSKQISDAKQALDEQDAKLTAFKLQYLGRLPDEAQNNMNILASYNSQLEAATEALNRLQQDKLYLQSQLAQQMAAWKASRTGTNQLTLEERLAALQNKLVMMQARYTDDYPDVIKLKRDISHLQEKINAANAAQSARNSQESNSNTPAYAEPPQIQQLQREIHQYDTNIQQRTKQQISLQNKIKKYEARVQTSPVIEQQFTEMTRNYKTALEFYRNLLTKQAQADMGADLEQRQQAEDFRVIHAASFSSSPSAPKRPLFAGGGAAGGLCLGIAIALWLELRDKLIRTERDVEFYLQLPTLALVPMTDKEPDRHMRHLPAGLTGDRDGQGVTKDIPAS